MRLQINVYSIIWYIQNVNSSVKFIKLININQIKMPILFDKIIQ